VAKNFIQGAIKHPGALTRKAKKAGESPMQFARQHNHTPGETGREARFALILAGLPHRGKSKK
jgi:hypothetical protein